MGFERILADLAAIGTASQASLFYATFGFPFDAKTASVQAGIKRSVQECVFRRGLPFVALSAYVREVNGNCSTYAARQVVRLQLDDKSWEKWIHGINFGCGMVQAIADSIIGTPIVALKQMVFTDQAPNARTAFIKRYRSSGIIHGFYKGSVWLMMLRNCIATGLKFMIFAHVSSKQDSSIEKMTKGGAVSIGISSITYPLDRIRNAMVFTTTTSPREAIRSIYRKNGILGFYAGFLATASKIFASGACSSFGMSAVLRTTENKPAS